MIDPFHAAVDPIFLYVLDVLDGIAAGRSPHAAQTQKDVVDLLELADARIGGSEEWTLTRYALVAWIDEVLLDCDWSGRQWWTNNALEAELFGTRDCSERFYLQAERARSLPDTRVLSVFYNCVVLGFRGMYRTGSLAESFSRADGLPDSLDTWLRRMSLTIEKRQPSPLTADRLPAGAAPRTARRWFIGSGFLLLVLLIVNGLVYQLRDHV